MRGVVYRNLVAGRCCALCAAVADAPPGWWRVEVQGVEFDLCDRCIDDPIPPRTLLRLARMVYVAALRGVRP